MLVPPRATRRAIQATTIAGDGRRDRSLRIAVLLSIGVKPTYRVSRQLAACLTSGNIHACRLVLRVRTSALGGVSRGGLARHGSSPECSYMSGLSVPSYPEGAGLGLRTNGELNLAARGGIRLLALPCVPRSSPVQHELCVAGVGHIGDTRSCPASRPHRSSISRGG